MNPDPTSLDRLHDIIAPPPVPWWPPATGWYWVIALLFAFGIYFAAKRFVYWQHNAYRREALAEWHRHNALLSNPTTCTNALMGMAELLKRTALSAFPRPQVAALTGREWLAFLDQTTAMHHFDSETGALLERAAYNQINPSEVDLRRAQDAAELAYYWIAHHRIENATGGQKEC